METNQPSYREKISSELLQQQQQQQQQQQIPFTKSPLPLNKTNHDV
jgi:hypothetical protein